MAGAHAEQLGAATARFARKRHLRDQACQAKAMKNFGALGLNSGGRLRAMGPRATAAGTPNRLTWLAVAAPQPGAQRLETPAN